jgi:hypothetical protein
MMQTAFEAADDREAMPRVLLPEAQRAVEGGKGSETCKPERGRESASQPWSYPQQPSIVLQCTIRRSCPPPGELPVWQPPRQRERLRWAQWSGGNRKRQDSCTQVTDAMST